MFYCLYETKNLVNGKIYVGVHRTSDLEDGYLGSGKVINRAIKKYGKDKFFKTILETFDNANAMYEREREIVTDTFLSRTDVYNKRCGGLGGFDHINNDNQLREKTTRAMRRWNKENNFGGSWSWSKEAREKVVSTAKANQKKASEASRIAALNPSEKARRSKVLSDAMKGENNKARGTHFYVNPETQKVTRYKEGEQPLGWITTKENYELTRKIPERWYNDGTRNYLIPFTSSKVQELNLKRGRIKAQGRKT